MDKHVAVIFLNQYRTEYLVYGPFENRRDALWRANKVIREHPGWNDPWIEIMKLME